MQWNELSHPLKGCFFLSDRAELSQLKSWLGQRKKQPVITSISQDIALLEYKGTTDFSCFYLIPHLGCSHLCPKARLLTRLHVSWDTTHALSTTVTWYCSLLIHWPWISPCHTFIHIFILQNFVTHANFTLGNFFISKGEPSIHPDRFT